MRQGLSSRIYKAALDLICFLPVIILAAGMVLNPAFLTVIRPGDDFNFHLVRGIELVNRGLPAIDHSYVTGGSLDGYSIVYPPLIQLAAGWLYLIGGIPLALGMLVSVQLLLFVCGTWWVAYRLYGRIPAFVAGFISLVALPEYSQLLSPTTATFVVALSAFAYYFFVKRNQLGLGLTLIIAAYVHYSGAALWAGALLIALIDPRSNQWMFKPLAISFVAALPLLILFLLNISHFHSSPFYSTSFNLMFIPVVIAAAISIVVNRFDKESVAGIAFIASLSIFWLAGNQFYRVLFSAFPILAVLAGRLFVSGSNNERFRFLVLILVALLAVRTVSLLFIDSEDLISSMRTYQGQRSEFAAMSYSTAGFEDAARALHAFSSPGEVVFTAARDSPILGFLSSRRVSNYLPYDWNPPGYDPDAAARSSRVFFNSMHDEYQPPELNSSYLVYYGVAGAVFIRAGDPTIPCFGDPYYCRALMNRDESLCSRISDDSLREFCRLDVATTAGDPNLCKGLSPTREGFCRYVLSLRTSPVSTG